MRGDTTMPECSQGKSLLAQVINQGREKCTVYCGIRRLCMATAKAPWGLVFHYGGSAVRSVRNNECARWHEAKSVYGHSMIVQLIIAKREELTSIGYSGIKRVYIIYAMEKAP